MGVNPKGSVASNGVQSCADVGFGRSEKGKPRTLQNINHSATEMMSLDEINELNKSTNYRRPNNICSSVCMDYPVECKVSRQNRL